MRCPSAIEDEAGRLIALSEYGLQDQEVVPDLEIVVRIAARMLDTPMAAVNMIGSDRVFIVAGQGVGEFDMRREVSFCAHAITQNEVMVVPDATMDERFHGNPLVSGPAGVRFYAGVPLFSPDGHALGALCVLDTIPRPVFAEEDRERLKDLARLASDRLEHLRLHRARQGSATRFEEVAVNSPTPIVCFNQAHRLNFWNKAATTLFGYSAEELSGKSLQLLIPKSDTHLTDMLDALLYPEHALTSDRVTEALGRRKDGSLLPIKVSLFSWQHDGQQCFGAMLEDITEKLEQTNRLIRLENFDELTGLANRALFQQRVVQALEEGTRHALIAVDLDNFKDINDTLGLSAGDHVLSIVADRMLQSIRLSDIAARLAGTEFAILLPQLTEPQLASSIADGLIAAIARPIVVENHEVRVVASCGIAFSPQHGRLAEDLMGSANLALYQAKALGRGCSSVFTPALRSEAEQRRISFTELHRAVEEQELELYYQPQVRISDCAIVGAEALLRWNHPEKGCLSPGYFLRTLESCSLAGTVGDWVLETACAQWAHWNDLLHTPLRIGINLFSAQFDKSGLDRQVAQVLDRYHIPPQSLELEITENIILNRDELILEPLRHLREIGICIAFDDFGTGYASLSMLKNYPLTRLKIDQSFVRNMCASRRDEVTVAAAIALARNYELQVIAEGVETREQLDRLLLLSCDEVQGYFFGKPMPASDFLEMLRAGNCQGCR